MVKKRICVLQKFEYMKELLLSFLLTVCALTSLHAQKIQVVDRDGNAIPYANVMTTDAKLIGTTDLDGVLNSVNGAKNIVITHVAYQSQTVTIPPSSLRGGGEGLRVTLADATFDLPEITVTKKEYTYLQVYYRVVAINKEGVQYYRSGISDNFLNKSSGKQETSKQHIVKSQSTMLKLALNMFVGGKIDNYAKMHTETVEKTLQENFPRQGLRFVASGAGRKNIVDKYGTIGSITDKNGKRRYSFDLHKAALHKMQAEGKTKDLKKAKQAEAKNRNIVSSSYRAYSIDGNGKYNPEDFLMEQHMLSFESENNGQTIIILDYYASDRGYVTKEEMKAIKKRNKAKLSFSYLQNFERSHNIPPLAPEILAKVKALAQ